MALLEINKSYSFLGLDPPVCIRLAAVSAKTVVEDYLNKYAAHA